MIAFHASAAAWFCVVATAAALACVQDACTSAGALQGLPSRWQMNPAITAMLSADPWLKSSWLAATNASVSRPSRPASKRMLALEHEPRSSAARFGSVGRTSRVKRFFRLLAAWHWVFCSSQSETSAEIAPLLAALAQALCCTSQDRPRAAFSPTKVSPFTEKGRSPVDEMTGGGAPPRVPVKAWTLVPVAPPVLSTRC